MSENPRGETADFPDPDSSPLKAGFRTGFIAIVGRPNVGKSTLMNRLIGQKISIVSRKAQTTRHRVTGILTHDQAQYVFVDTPGFQTRHRNALNQSMNRFVTQALRDVNVILMVIEAGHFGEEDRKVIALLPEDTPVILVINKLDWMNDPVRMLPFLSKMSQAHPFVHLIPVCAQRGQHLDRLLDLIGPLLPEAPPLFAEDEITDRSERFLAAEFLREKLFRLLGDELPYGIAVEIEQFEQEGALRRIHAAVLVDKQAHKAIVIGQGGQHLKRIASEARTELETLFQGKVFLEVWVKVKAGWADNRRALKSLGFD
jgi:GTPase